MRLIDADKMNLLLGISDRDIYAKYMLDKMPTIDAVPVVRCRECKHSHLDGWLCGGYGMMPEHTTFPHEYCSRGERKEGADNG